MKALSTSPKSRQQMKIALILLMSLGMGIAAHAEESMDREKKVSEGIAPAGTMLEDSVGSQGGYLSREDLEKQAWIRIRQNRRPPLSSNQPLEKPLSKSLQK